ncbi:MAG: hypothetical protein KDB20_07765 [Microthrixaceae bacterium]|nr:hypothetical protein [Microthrixaceae bacterium]
MAKAVGVSAEKDIRVADAHRSPRRAAGGALLGGGRSTHRRSGGSDPTAVSNVRGDQQ